VDFSDLFAGLSNNEIARGIGAEQTRLLRDFFGQGVEGARSAEQQFSVPAGLVKASLVAYHEIARRTISERRDTLGVQRRRIALVERALRTLDAQAGS
jgi:hypothetical protein